MKKNFDIVGYLKSMWDGGTVMDHVKLLGVFFFFGIASISFKLMCDENKHRIDSLTKEVKELRYQSMSLSSKYMNEAKQSKVIQRVQEVNLGLKELTEAPRIIYDED